MAAVTSVPEEHWVTVDGPDGTRWRADAAVGKTVVSSAIIDRVDIDALIGDVLEGIVDPHARGELRRVSHGNPLALRELVLGGVTRTMLRSMTVPVLMSH